MKTATIRELRNDFSRISKWLAKGETVEIIKRGKPVADLVPKASGRPRTLLGCTPSPYPLPDDIDDPVTADWEVLK
jgi:antitoxin (DNA-binding transcriptional repressor) of toxin-antitoxin stability system